MCRGRDRPPPFDIGDVPMTPMGEEVGERFPPSPQRKKRTLPGRGGRLSPAIGEEERFQALARAVMSQVGDMIGA